MTTGTNTDVEPLMTPKEVAGWVRVSEATLCRWRQSGHGPPVTWLSARIPRYDRSEVATWLTKAAA